ncbi:hypothetical protein JCM6882_003443 [Rhodosporidiobolus microsporus]
MADQQRSEDTLTLTLRLATHPIRGPNTIHSLPSIPRTASIRDLKQRLEDSWDGKPRKEGITAVKGGRVLRDQEVLAEVFDEELKTTPLPDLVLHIIVRPTAWSAPFQPAVSFAAPIDSPSVTRPSSPPSGATTPAPTPAPAAAEATDVLAATPLPSPGGAAPPPEPDSVPPTPTIRETPPTPVPTPPNREGYAPAYLSSPSAAAAAPSPLAGADPATPSAAAPPPLATAAAQAGAASSPFLPYLAHLQRLIPLQRALLLLNLQKAHVHYQALVGTLSAQLNASGGATAEPGEIKELVEVEELFKGCGLWALVEDTEKRAEKEYEERMVQLAMPVVGDRPVQEQFVVVQLNDLPYLLHMPAALVGPQPHPHLPTFLRLRRAQMIHHTLTVLLQLLITYQPSLPAIAHGRAGTGPAPAAPGPPPVIRQGYRPMGVPPGAAQQQAAAAAALAAAAGLPIPAPAAGAPAGARVRRAATLSITLNIDTLLSLLIPLFLLSLKLAFLLWIFGRHASTTKRIILGVMAVLWVGWEGWRLVGAAGRRRRGAAAQGADAARGERERQAERDRRRAARAAAAPPPAAGVAQPGAPQPAQQPPAPGVVAAPQPQPQPQPRQRRRSPPPSLLSPKYWLNALAAVGLVAEARELGLQPRFIAGRPIPPAPATPPSPLRRALRNVWVGVVLFVGTLSPEVERKRKRALEKRERLVKERREARERQRAVEAVQREREREQRERAEKATREATQKQSEEALRLRRAFSVGVRSDEEAAVAAAAAAEEERVSGQPSTSAFEASRAAAEKRHAEGTQPQKKDFWEYELRGEAAVMQEVRRQVREREEQRNEKEVRDAARRAFETRAREGGLQEAQGREKVSDEELFRGDEGEASEAFAPAAAGPSSSSPSPAAASTSALPPSTSTAASPPPSSPRPLPTPPPPPPQHDEHDDDPLDLDGDASSASSTAGDAEDDGREGAGAGEGAQGGRAGEGREGEVDQVVALF